MVEGLWQMWMFGCRRAKEKRLFMAPKGTPVDAIVGDFCE
jgi:hypothetical protein